MFYAILIALMCFSPQSTTGLLEVSTPGIQRFGRLLLLLTPFNSIVNLTQVKSVGQLIWVFLQNVMNVFLLFPLMLQLLILFPNLRTVKKVLSLGFLLSLGIELTQLILDLLIDANRVFEVDDLWTNTLGSYLALVTYRFFSKKFLK
ncbi:VanZF-related protein [Streptococcus sp. DD10]|nr:VanZF-related protein [Streptococcus sp. DD10]